MNEIFYIVLCLCSFEVLYGTVIDFMTKPFSFLEEESWLVCKITDIPSGYETQIQRGNVLIARECAILPSFISQYRYDYPCDSSTQYFNLTINKFSCEDNVNWTCGYHPTTSISTDFAAKLGNGSSHSEFHFTREGPYITISGSCTSSCLQPLATIMWTVAGNNVSGETSYLPGSCPCQSLKTTSTLKYNYYTTTKELIDVQCVIDNGVPEFREQHKDSYTVEEYGNAALFTTAVLFSAVCILSSIILLVILMFTTLIFGQTAERIVKIQLLIFVIYTTIAVISFCLSIAAVASFSQTMTEWIVCLVLLICTLMASVAINITIFISRFTETVKHLRVSTDETIKITCKTNRNDTIRIFFKDNYQSDVSAGQELPMNKDTCTLEEAENLLFYHQCLNYRISKCTISDAGVYTICCGKLKAKVTVEIYGRVNQAMFDEEYLQDIPKIEVKKPRELPNMYGNVK